jgi:tetratricopeptide (TPR) repeat protein
VEDGYQIWSERYDCELDDVFSIQDEISSSIIKELKPRILRGEREKLVRRYTEDLEAHNLYLKGLYFWNKRTGEGMKRGMECFQQAINKDPNFALAYVGLANSYNLFGFWGFMQSIEAFQKAKELTENALKIEPTLAEAHASSGWINLVYNWDFQAAERAFMKAINLNPGYANAHHWYGLCLMAMERYAEAHEEMKLAQQLEPLSLIIQSHAGVVHYFQRNYSKAIEQLEKTLEMDPSFGYGLYYLGRAYLVSGKLERAVTTFQKWAETGHHYASGYLAFTYGVAGSREEALKIAQELGGRSKEGHVPPLARAFPYVGLGELDDAFKWLDKAVDERESPMFLFRTYPEFDSLRSDPRYEKLLEKMGLKN